MGKKEKVIEIIRKHVVQIGEVGENTKLLDIGVDSVKYIQIIVDLEQEFEVEVDERYLIFARNITVKDLLSFI